MAGVMIGIDPHKASHTAVAVSGAEEPLGELRVRASAVQGPGLSRFGGRRAGPAALTVVRTGWALAEVRHAGCR